MVMLWPAVLVDNTADIAGGVVMVDMGSRAALGSPSAGKRRGNGTRELGKHEKPDQNVDKGAYGPEPTH